MRSQQALIERNYQEIINKEKDVHILEILVGKRGIIFAFAKNVI